MMLTGDALLRVVCLMTRRHMRVLRTGKESWISEIWKGCAVGGEQVKEVETAEGTESTDGATSVPPVASDAKNRDELAFQAFELMNARDEFKPRDKLALQQAVVPNESLLELVQLLLLIAPLQPHDIVSLFSSQLDDQRLQELAIAANCILASFGDGQKNGIGYETFDTVVSNTLPHLFDSLVPLFEHFLLPKHRAFHKRKDSSMDLPQPSSFVVSPSPEPRSQPATPTATYTLPRGPLLPASADILDLTLLSQLSFIFPPKTLPTTTARLRPLYQGHKHGYSMGAFEHAVSKHTGPTILLVSGTPLSPTTRQSSARAFLNDIPHRRLSSSVATPLQLDSLRSSSSESVDADAPPRIVYGAHVPVAWRATDMASFGDDRTVLFQLAPVHDVFPANPSGGRGGYVYFNKPPATYSGLGVGSPLPGYCSMSTSGSGPLARRDSVSSYSAHDTAYGSSSLSSGGFASPPVSLGVNRRSSLIGDEHVPLGPVSLHVDDALQFGVFTHLSEGGGSFATSRLPVGARAGSGVDWQDRFEIDSIEVWGI
jgi:hypothetical protein